MPKKTLMNTAVGTVIGMWTTAGLPYRESNQTLVLCRCACGTEKAVNIFNIMRGGSRSCGCECNSSLGVKPGEKFGRWTVIEPPFVEGIVTKAKCRCECGKERTIRLAQAINGTSTGCGCSRRRYTAEQKRAINAANMRKWNAKWYPILREMAFVALGGKECRRCGIADPRVLAFDHVNGGGGAERKRYSSIPMLKRIIADPSRFRVLCLNCNWLAHKYPGEFAQAQTA